MRPSEAASTRDVLIKRVKRLLDLHREKTELRTAVLPFLESLGRVALIGGAIRDVARAGKRNFSSDYDFVVYESEKSRFVEYMERSQGVRNRFGGYALKCFNVKVDVWHIEDTWAHTEGYRHVSRPEDLIYCTFFDWDSVVYDVSARRLILPDDYFDRLLSNVMDIRLEPNPNPIGSLVRALRRAALWNVYFGPRLTEFAKHHLLECEWRDIVELDARAFARPVLFREDRSKIFEGLLISESSPWGDVTLPIPPRGKKHDEQLKLPIEERSEVLSPF